MTAAMPGSCQARIEWRRSRRRRSGHVRPAVEHGLVVRRFEAERAQLVDTRLELLAIEGLAGVMSASAIAGPNARGFAAGRSREAASARRRRAVLGQPMTCRERARPVRGVRAGLAARNRAFTARWRARASSTRSIAAARPLDSADEASSVATCRSMIAAAHRARRRSRRRWPRPPPRARHSARAIAFMSMSSVRTSPPKPSSSRSSP